MLDGGAFKSINESASFIIISLMSALSCISGGMRLDRRWRKIRSVCLSLKDRITLDCTDEGGIRQIGVLVQVSSEWIPGFYVDIPWNRLDLSCGPGYTKGENQSFEGGSQ